MKLRNILVSKQVENVNIWHTNQTVQLHYKTVKNNTDIESISMK